jgi:uncharacterized membrane protein YjgN (DUF898 family)
MSDIPRFGRERQLLEFEYEGRAGELLPIVLVNSLLNIVTLTIYGFWGKTRVRRYLWQGVTVLGDRFEYTGTGGELFKGFLIVFFAVLLPFAILSGVIEANFNEEDSEYIFFKLAFGLVFVFLLGIAVYRARRYRLSRTMWRGVRGGQTGSAVAYAGAYFGWLILNGLTLSWTYPKMRLELMRRVMNNTYFGDRRFHFEGEAGPLYRSFAIAWGAIVGLLIVLGALAMLSEAEAVLPLLVIVVFLVVLPIVFAIYKAAEIRHFARCTTLEGLEFELEATAGSLMGLVAGNTLINVLTLGFGLPFAQLRTFRYVCIRLKAQGTIDIEAILQSADKGPGVGEGLADALDVGAV